MTSRASAACMDMVRHACGLATEQQHLAPIAMIEIGDRRRRRQQSEPQPFGTPPVFEGRPRGMPRQRHVIEVVHSGATEGAVGDRKASRLDDVRRHAKAGGEAQNRSGILRDVGLVQGDLHGALK